MDTSVLRMCRVCGRRAQTQEDLKLFAVKRQGRYGRDTICKACLNRRKLKSKPPLPYLRKCRVCEFEAETTQDLEKFVRNQESKYNRANLCKPCHNKYIYERNIENKVRRFDVRHKDELIKYFGIPMNCHFCGKKISKLNDIDKDSLVFHSLDGNHNNWNPENKTPVHRSCHSKHHNLGKVRKGQPGNIGFTGREHKPETIEKMREAQLSERHWRWQGNKASKHAKYLREWRRKGREENG